MRQFAETVLNGHPDKFCDFLADAIVHDVYRQDPQADVQVEVAMWRKQITLNGLVTSKADIQIQPDEIIAEVAKACGYLPEHPLNPTACKTENHIEFVDENPAKKNAPSNDQSIIIGYAGYDAKTNYLRPEQFLSWFLREKLVQSITGGKLQGHGPDGKILVSMREELHGWYVDQLLISMQQNDDLSFQSFYTLLREVIQEAYSEARRYDTRWKSSIDDITWLINPYGVWKSNDHEPDSGQTGRKLVMDFYGPRIPIGGGALYGKGLHHIDRLASYAARAFAIDHVQRGAKEVTIRLCYAPGLQSPMQIECDMDVKPLVDLSTYFQVQSMRQRIPWHDLIYSTDALGTFYNKTLSFNQPGLRPMHPMNHLLPFSSMNA